MLINYVHILVVPIMHQFVQLSVPSVCVCVFTHFLSIPLLLNFLYKDHIASHLILAYVHSTSLSFLSLSLFSHHIIKKKHTKTAPHARARSQPHHEIVQLFRDPEPPPPPPLPLPKPPEHPIDSELPLPPLAPPMFCVGVLQRPFFFSVCVPWCRWC